MAENYLLGSLRPAPGIIDARTIDQNQIKDVVTPRGAQGYAVAVSRYNPFNATPGKMFADVMNTRVNVASTDTTRPAGR